MSGSLRIVGGEWRGRRVSFKSVDGLRPTPDRVRETLFNWLQPVIAGARCLDLFAGSGALGLEAASRGAAQVVMLDNNPLVVSDLEQAVTTLAAGQVRVVQAEALTWVGEASAKFNIVFVDPPWTADLVERSCQRLQSSGVLAENARIYIEDTCQREELLLPEGWSLLRSKVAGEVGYHLARN